MRAGLRTLPLLFFILIGYLTEAQSMAHVPGQFLIRLSPNSDVANVCQSFFDLHRVRIQVQEKASNSLHIFLVQVENSSFSDAEILTRLNRFPAVLAAQLNFILENRGQIVETLLPNDPLFSQQWQYINNGNAGGVADADLDAEDAWALSTGGLTPAGDSIVIAVIDGGLSYLHPDLNANLYFNYADIPGDQIDNDNNGFVDDFKGWNVVSENDNIMALTGMHGTPVSGIIGAKGNNQKGVTGVNWNTKIMFVAGNETVSDILKAFEYVYSARKLYNDTQGEKGAFVVALNCSWGINYGQPVDAPLWCIALDQLGSVGIVPVASTANLGIDVDLEGDLPTTCPSDYLISVTSLNSSDEKPPGAAWGAQHVDLGAYGHGIFTLGSNNSYGIYEGTSFAAPHVSGAIGLLYAAACPQLIALAKIDPAAAAKLAKTWLLNQLTPNTTLQNITLTGGRLNLGKLIQAYENECPDCPAPFNLQTNVQSAQQVKVTWLQAPNVSKTHLFWRPLGSDTWFIQEEVTSPYVLSGLEGCTQYEYLIKAFCTNTNGFASSIDTFETAGCCNAPTAINILWLSENAAAIQWTESTDQNQYIIRFWQQGSAISVFTVNATEHIFPDLEVCQDYYIQVKSICSGVASDFSPVFHFKTLGCGACTEASYCPAGGQSAQTEWIAGVSLGPWILNAGDSPGPGYENFAGLQETIPELNAFESYPIKIIPGQVNTSKKYYFRVYMDFNNDGVFQADELVFDPGFPLNQVAEGTIIIPNDVTNGITRMRIMLKHKTDSNTPPEACDFFEFGQVEDYCVQLNNQLISAPVVDDMVSFKIWPVPSYDQFHIITPIPGGVLQVLDAQQKTILNEKINTLHSVDVSGWISGFYIVKYSVGDQSWTTKFIRL